MTHEQLQDAHIAALREIVELRAEIERLTHELTQANEACAALREGKPLGPIIGAQTILNQAKEIERLKARLAESERELEHWTYDSFKRRETALREAFQDILDIGKRDMSNPKPDGYFETAREAMKETA